MERKKLKSKSSRKRTYDRNITTLRRPQRKPEQRPAYNRAARGRTVRHVSHPSKNQPDQPHTEPESQLSPEIISSLPQITINGSIFTDDSFSIVARGLAGGLSQNGVDVSIDAWAEGNRSHPIEKEISALLKKGPKREIGIRISHPNSFHVLKQYKYRVGKAYFETFLFPNIPPNDWVTECRKYCDQVWVSSTFNKEICYKSGLDDIDLFVVHDGFDPALFCEIANSSTNPIREQLPFDNDTFIFLTVGNSQKRKGTDLLYQAITQEFTKKEKVALVYKSYAPWAWGAAKYAKHGWNPKLAKKFNIELKEDPRIYHWGEVNEWLDPKDNEWKPILINSDIPYLDLPDLYRAGDCFVLPTYGEGAGICCVEAMACGIPVITSNWSAQLDYCNNTNSYLIEGEKYEPAFEGEDWQGEWIVPSLDQLKSQMRYVYEHPEMVKVKVQKAIKDSKRFTWKNCAKEAIRVLSFLIPEVFVEEARY